SARLGTIWLSSSRRPVRTRPEGGRREAAIAPFRVQIALRLVSQSLWRSDSAHLSPLEMREASPRVAPSFFLRWKRPDVCEGRSGESRGGRSGASARRGRHGDGRSVFRTWGTARVIVA